MTLIVGKLHAHTTVPTVDGTKRNLCCMEADVGTVYEERHDRYGKYRMYDDRRERSYYYVEAKTASFILLEILEKQTNYCYNGVDRGYRTLCRSRVLLNDGNVVVVDLDPGQWHVVEPEEDEEEDADHS